MTRVTREQFAGLQCNGCGDCCERFFLPKPLGLADTLNWLNPKYADLTDDMAIQGKLTARWLADVIPLDEAETGVGRMPSKCLRFKRIDDNAGICTQYDLRPHACSGFPYGEPVDTYGTRCSFNVEIERDDA